MYDNWLFFPPFLLPSKKEGEEEESEISKPVLNKLFK
jgi:hypothetical protein